ncbi:hypothetical protein GPA19_08040 [Azoarcus indigens]|uniref:Uncharacterized protein n=1 Tax=Azoarcus indigens TaxID=29545 RepID=A0A4V3BMF8_9RHOO|nr:hypothetical protein [Azoarcus indigens]NMG64894.1 hypothetical protein [Azoarcus indigens]TDN50432.1 hypothetical protein C7389_109126 [Azoarcus indigens]
MKSTRNLCAALALGLCLALSSVASLAAGVADYLENKIVDHVLRGISYTAPTSVCAALLTGAPDDASTGATLAEAAWTGYSRAQLNPSASNWTSTQGGTSGASTGTGGTTSNAVLMTFGTAPSTGPTVVSHLAILDSCTAGAGNVLFYAPLAASKTINAGDPAPTVPVGAITVRPTD